MRMRFCDDWLLLPQRFALHVPSATAVLADVHLGYSAARQRLGDAIPSRSVAEEMQPLMDAARAHTIEKVVIAGDLFERGYDADIHQQLLDVLARHSIRFIGLVPGNHDRGLDKVAQMPIFADGYDLAGWQILHGDQASTHAKTVSGHWHPALRRHGRKFPCFLMRGTHLVLPAFSLDAAGVDVTSDRRWRDWKCCIIDGSVVRGPSPVVSSHANGNATDHGPRTTDSSHQ